GVGRLLVLLLRPFGGLCQALRAVGKGLRRRGTGWHLGRPVAARRLRGRDWPGGRGRGGRGDGRWRLRRRLLRRLLRDARGQRQGLLLVQQLQRRCPGRGRGGGRALRRGLLLRGRRIVVRRLGRVRSRLRGGSGLGGGGGGRRRRGRRRARGGPGLRAV